MSSTKLLKKSRNTQSPKKQSKKKMKEVDINFNYDESADVLYASVGEPKPAKSIDYDNGIVLRIDPKSGEYIGFTIINYMAQKKQGHLKKIPHFKKVELPLY